MVLANWTNLFIVRDNFSLLFADNKSDCFKAGRKKESKLGIKGAVVNCFARPVALIRALICL